MVLRSNPLDESAAMAAVHVDREVLGSTPGRGRNLLNTRRRFSEGFSTIASRWFRLNSSTPDKAVGQRELL